MKEIIWGGIGLIIAICAAVYMIRLILLKRKGQLVLAEVVEVREKKNRKGMTVSYIHRMKFECGGKTYEKDDKAGFNQPLKIGEKKLIWVNPADLSRFEYDDEIKKNIIIAGVLVGVAVIFSLRWLITGVPNI